MREHTRVGHLMEMFCFDYPYEVFPSHRQSGLKEGYGRFSGWLPSGIFKRLGNIDMRLLL